jgi:hypothetical protein
MTGFIEIPTSGEVDFCEIESMIDDVETIKRQREILDIIAEVIASPNRSDEVKLRRATLLIEALGRDLDWAINNLEVGLKRMLPKPELFADPQSIQTESPPEDGCLTLKTQSLEVSSLTVLSYGGVSYGGVSYDEVPF